MTQQSASLRSFLEWNCWPNRSCIWLATKNQLLKYVNISDVAGGLQEKFSGHCWEHDTARVPHVSLLAEVLLMACFEDYVNIVECICVARMLHCMLYHPERDIANCQVQLVIVIANDEVYSGEQKHFLTK